MFFIKLFHSVFFELLMGVEPMTSSLPRKCSTTELQQQVATFLFIQNEKKYSLSLGELWWASLIESGRRGFPINRDKLFAPYSVFSFFESGRRGSNPRPSAWKANALSTELLPHFKFKNLLI